MCLGARISEGNNESQGPKLFSLLKTELLAFSAQKKGRQSEDLGLQPYSYITR